VIEPRKLGTARWVEIIEAAHHVGLRSTATVMYGHVEQPRHVAAHLGTIRAIQKRTGGFTEFVPLGFIHEKNRLFQHLHARPVRRHPKTCASSRWRVCSCARGSQHQMSW